MAPRICARLSAWRRPVCALTGDASIQGRRATVMAKTYFNLAGGSLIQDWSNIGQITTNDSWAGVPSIEGYLGQDITTSTGTDPRTLTADSSVANDLDVIANQSNTAITNGGVAE